MIVLYDCIIIIQPDPCTPLWMRLARIPSPTLKSATQDPEKTSFQDFLRRDTWYTASTATMVNMMITQQLDISRPPCPPSTLLDICYNTLVADSS